MTAPWLIKKPTNPSVWDDEFESTELDPKWTRISGGGHGTVLQSTLDPYASFTTGNHRESLHKHRSSWYMRQTVAGYGVTFGLSEGIQQTLSSLPTDCFMYARVSRNVRRASNTDGDGEVAIRLSDGGTNYMLIMLDSFGTPRVEGLYARSTTALGYANIALVRDYVQEADPLTYLGIGKVGNTYHGWIASASGNWVWCNSFTHAVAITTLDIYCSNENSASPGNMLAGIDFFRVLTGKVVP